MTTLLEDTESLKQAAMSIAAEIAHVTARINSSIAPQIAALRQRITAERPDGYEQMLAGLDQTEALMAKLNGTLS